jgi:hypothetical protein
MSRASPRRSPAPAGGTSKAASPATSDTAAPSDASTGATPSPQDRQAEALDRGKTKSKAAL